MARRNRMLTLAMLSDQRQKNRGYDPGADNRGEMDYGSRHYTWEVSPRQGKNTAYAAPKMTMGGWGMQEYPYAPESAQGPEMGRRGPIYSPRMDYTPVIGFERDRMPGRGSDATYWPRSEGSTIAGASPLMGGAKAATGQGFDKFMAEEWCARMENSDGTTGPHWTMEQTTKELRRRGMSFDPVEFWAAMNATYSDLHEALKKNGVTDIDTYIDLAVAFWLDDRDAGGDKLGRYYSGVVLG